MKHAMLAITLLILIAVILPGCGQANPIPTRSPEVQSSNNSTESPPSPYLPKIPRISVDEVKTKLDAGANLVIIDARSQASYNKSHIAGAISLPLKTMAAPYSNLDGHDQIITYCT